MTVTLELPAEMELTALAQAKARGVRLEEYLPALLAQAIQESTWPEASAARQTMLAGEPVLRRLWDTPEEDEAWKDL